MRLGDLDALKEAIKNNGYSHYFEIFDIIDNAPTVEEVSEIEFKEPLPLVKAQKIVKTLSRRPKGEWIKHINNLFPEESTEECPFCHEEQLLRLGNDDNFCPNCGADMRGGKE